MIDKESLEKLYKKYNDRKHIHPDPLEFLYDYSDIKEREVAGLVAASLAYGQVNQILKSVSSVLKKIGPKPSEYLAGANAAQLEKDFSQFKHRFTTGIEIASFLKNTGEVLEKYGSLNKCFLAGFEKEKALLPALLFFIRELRLGQCKGYNSLIPMPDGKCAYKRMNLYLRWMIRKDNVDPGGWKGIKPSELIVPLDIHMHRVSLSYGFTQRKQADIRTALEITESFRYYDPEDPVKYDFSLTRQGIHIRNKPTVQDNKPDTIK